MNTLQETRKQLEQVIDTTVSLSPEEIEALVSAVLASGFTKLEQEMHAPEHLAVMLGISRSLVLKLYKPQRWPHRKVGGSVKFSRADVDEIHKLTAVELAPVRTTRTRRTMR